MGKVICEIHNIEYENKARIEAFNIDIDVKCPLCIEVERQAKQKRKELEEYNQYVEQVKWRMEVSGLPKVVINTKNKMDFISNEIKKFKILQNLFIYGNSGVGKTMSLKYLICRNYMLNIVYADCILLKNYTYHKLQKFYEDISNIDCICLDELQALPIEILEHIIEIIYNNDGNFILCGNYSLQEAKDFIASLPYRIKSRLQRKKLNFLEAKSGDKRI